MKVLVNESTLIFPLDKQLNILVDNNYKNLLIECLQQYFGKKKKNFCKIYDEYENIIQPKEMEFIYLPYNSSIEGNFDFKSKSLMNTETSEFIINNPQMFQTIDYIRESIKSLQTDKGMFALKKILSKGLNSYVDIDLKSFDVSLILQMMEIKGVELSLIDKYLVLYNLLLYENRDTLNIVYLDLPITEDVLNWIYKSKDNNTIYIIENNQIDPEAANMINDCSILKLSPYNYLETIEFDSQELQNYIYIFHPYIIRYINQQTEKNIQLFHQFNDSKSSFYLMFSNAVYSNNR